MEFPDAEWRTASCNYLLTIVPTEAVTASDNVFLNPGGTQQREIVGMGLITALQQF
jgi:hypothetical protein